MTIKASDLTNYYLMFSPDITAVILVIKAIKMIAMLMPLVSPVGFDNFSYTLTLLCSDQFAYNAVYTEDIKKKRKEIPNLSFAT